MKSILHNATHFAYARATELMNIAVKSMNITSAMKAIGRDMILGG